MANFDKFFISWLDLKCSYTSFGYGLVCLTFAIILLLISLISLCYVLFTSPLLLCGFLVRKVSDAKRKLCK